MLGLQGAATPGSPGGGRAAAPLGGPRGDPRPGSAGLGRVSCGLLPPHSHCVSGGKQRPSCAMAECNLV